MKMIGRGKRAAIIAAVFSLMVFSGIYIGWRLYPNNQLLEISVLDVGQGDAILFEVPTGQVMLVDGGPDKKILRRLGEELPFWERRIDIIALTHPHEDHFAGLNLVLERYEVGTVLITGVEAHSQGYQRFLEIINQKHIPLLIIKKPEQLVFGDVHFNIIYPDHSFKDRRMSNLNNSSLVIKVQYRLIDMLLTGDAEKEEEGELLSSGVNLQAEILKVGHHGSETSSTEEFLQAVKPALALISSGVGNTYGHPSLRTLKRLDRLGIFVRRTDSEGTIHLLTDGQVLYQ